MNKKGHRRKLSIKAKILGILAVVLLLSLGGHLGIFYYSSYQIYNIIKNSLTEIYYYENNAHLELKDSILSENVIEDVRVYAHYIDKEVEPEDLPFNESKEPDIDAFFQVNKGNPGKSAAKIINLLQVIEVEKHRPGYMLIIDNRGRIIAIEGAPSRPFFKEHFQLHTRLLKSKNKAIVRCIEGIIKSSRTSGIIKATFKGKEFHLVFSRINSINCILVKVLPEDYLNEQVQEFNKKFNDYTKTIRTNIMSLYDHMNNLSLVIFMAIIIVAYAIGSFLSKSISNPLVRLKEATGYIGKGNLARHIDIMTGDEIEELADNFNVMTGELKTYIKELSDSISREKAIEQEIKMAANIQKSSLPRPTPQFKAGANIDLQAFLQPSKIVSGDFYDYFFIDEEHFFFALGDVSGKSVSAALFMMTTKLLMKRFALKGLRPGEILQNVNDTLALDNETCMYSTIFCGILNSKTGHLTYCNGGHTAPLSSI